MSHATTMDAVYKFQRHIYDFTRKYYLLGRDPMLRQLTVRDGETVLEIGCGTARNLILAARAHPQARFLGIDASEEMLKTARLKIRAARLEKQIRVGFGYAESLDPVAIFGPQTRIDHILFSYSLSMIPDWQAALRHAFTLLPSGGQLHVVDFGDQGGLPGWFRQALEQWLEKFHVAIRRDLEDEVSMLARDRGGSVRSRALYRGYAWTGVVTLPKA